MRLRAMLACLATGLVAVASPAFTPLAHATEGGSLAPVMLVLDASGSMNEKTTGGTRIDVAKRAIGTLVDTAPAGSRLGLTVYGTGQSGSTTDKADGCRDVTVVRPVGAVDGPALKSAAQAIVPKGWTPVGPALRKAAEALPKEGPRSVVLVSDGEDTCAPPEPCEVARELAAQGVDLRVHTVGFAADAKTREQLMCIARASGGTYADAPDAGTLERELNRITQRALRSYEPTGTPVSGGPDPARAPLVTPGNYLDVIGDTEVRYYAIDVPVDNTVYVSGTVISQAKAIEAIDVQQINARSTPCRTDTSVVTGTNKVLTAMVRSEASGDDTSDCAKPGRQVFAVTRRGSGPPAPLELQLLLEPPVRDQGPPEGVVAEYEEPGGAPQAVVGGNSFAGATTLPGSGHYTDTIAAGEWVFYRVRLEWGQSLAFQTRVGGGDVRDILGIQVRFYNPIRQSLATDSMGVTNTERIFSGSLDPFATRPVRYQNRADRQQIVADMLPGWYYIAVSADKGDHQVRTLAVDVSVAGTKEPGPVYAQGPVAGLAPEADSASPNASRPDSPEASPAEDEDTGAAASGRDEDSDSAAFGGPIVWVGLPLALILGAALTAWVLRGRGRRATPTPTIPNRWVSRP